MLLWAGWEQERAGGRDIKILGRFLIPNPVAALMETITQSRNLRACATKLGSLQKLETWESGLEGSDVLITQTCALENLLCTGDFLTRSLGLLHEPILGEDILANDSGTFKLLKQTHSISFRGQTGLGLADTKSN